MSPALPLLAAARANINVAPASHGETQADETLGNGNAAASFQRFPLMRKPVTRLPSAGAVDPIAELSVRVNGELWREVPSLFSARPTDRVFTMRYAADGTSTIGFGDGVTGARLPSGAGNVQARYRTGMGLAGRMRAGQLSTLLARPPGLLDVTNPLAADGGADPETLEEARSLAPATVRTFGRAIALSDFEDVARQTGLAARARASWTWIGTERAVQLTVAGPGGSRLSSAAMTTLFGALGTARDPNHVLVLGNLWRVPVVIEARILRHLEFEADAVALAARSALMALMNFDVQPLGRALHLSRIVTALQDTAGVSAVDVDAFHIKGAQGWTAAQLARRAATADAVQPFIRLFDARPRPPAATLDPLALAGLALDPDVEALPAEQAFVESPDSDILLHVVDAL
jgi:predicted phage baseplate assembly protein